MSPSPPPAWWRWLALAMVAACGLGLNLRQIYDLDFGFHLAMGRHLLANGLVRHEFLAPALAESPLAPTYLLGSVALTLAWMAGGGAGLTLLKTACYTAAFVVAAKAAMRRASAWPLLAGALACAALMAVAPRLVERPGMFSALGLALVIAVAARLDNEPAQPSLGALIAATVCSALWSWIHPEWLIGVAATLLLIMPRCQRRAGLVLAGVVVLVPLLSHAWLHPMGLGAWWRVIELPLGGASAMNVSEYHVANWSIMPLAPGLMVAAVAAAAHALWRRAWGEGALLVLLTATCTTSPRGILPLAIVALPSIAGMLDGALARLDRKHHKLANGGFVAVAFAALMAGVMAMPWRPFGVGVHPLLDARGVGAVLAGARPDDGPIAAEYGAASLLLAQPGAAACGVVMDGRLESYPPDYIDSTYMPLSTTDDDALAAHLEAIGAGYYFEMYPRRGASSRVAALRQRGWELVAWDNAGRLLARPGLATARGWRVVSVDPADETLIAANEGMLEGAIAELGAVCEEQESAGIATGRARLAQAAVAVRLGRDDVAAYGLAVARREGLDTTSRYQATAAEYATLAGDRGAFDGALRALRRQGRTDLADALDRQWRARAGEPSTSQILTPDTD